MNKIFFERLGKLEKEQEALLSMPNKIVGLGNGIIDRYKNPVLTAAHTPLYWRYDLNENANPYLMERITINSVFKAGAIKFNDTYIVVARVEA
ncbi:MAG TPA: glycosidase, partial [Chitinophagaceae bacterium]